MSKNKFKIFILLFIFTTITFAVMRQTNTDIRLLAQTGIICPTPGQGKNSLQLVACYAPTPTPTLVPTPTSSTTNANNGTVPPTSGEASRCQGNIVHFGIEKKLLKMGNGRPGTCFKPKWIVMHITAGNGKTAQVLFNYFNSGSDGRKVGSQFGIGVNGDSLQMTESFADKFETAYHTGNYNNGSIGIEMTSPKVFNSKGEMPPKQYAEALRLVKALMKQYNIPVGPNDHTWKSRSTKNENPPPGVYGHYQFSPGRRTDPGAGWLRDFRAEIAKP